MVSDSANTERIMGVHQTKAEAYRQANQEQERLRRFDPMASYLNRIRQEIAQTLVVR